MRPNVKESPVQEASPVCAMSGASAMTTDSTIKPRTSSITAAPRIVDPTLDLSWPRLIKACAVMVTLVAVKMVPMKMASA